MLSCLCVAHTGALAAAFANCVSTSTLPSPFLTPPTFSINTVSFPCATVSHRYTHSSGNLKYHPTQNYHKAKKGWMVVKSTSVGESDYYVNGSTGVTTYEKPLELMTPEERLYWDNFQSHKLQAESFIGDMKALQEELEETKYERDIIFQRALEQGTQMSDILARRKAKKKNLNQLLQVEDDGKDSIIEVSKKVVPSWWNGITEAASEYKQSLLAPQGRKRGAAKSEYIAYLLAEKQENK
jgi:hypothetical protein